MTIADFEKQPRGPYLFDWWVGRQRIATPLGLFSVEFHILGDDDTDPPDEEMSRRAAGLVSYTESHGEFILDIVFGHYLLKAEDPDWLRDCGVPRGLTRNRVADYVRKTAVLSWRVTLAVMRFTAVRSMLFHYGMKSMRCL
ncbi:MAG: hypothetical protein WCF68_00465 [Terriglobales bacterium]